MTTRTQSQELAVPALIGKGSSKASAQLSDKG